MILDFLKNRKKFAAGGQTAAVNWFNIAGIVLGAAVANTLHWGIAALNAMIVAAICFFVGELLGKNR